MEELCHLSYYLFNQLLISIGTHAYLFYSRSYNSILSLFILFSKLLQLWTLEVLQFGSCFSFNKPPYFLFSVTRRCSRFILYFPCLSPGSIRACILSSSNTQVVLTCGGGRRVSGVWATLKCHFSASQHPTWYTVGVQWGWALPYLFSQISSAFSSWKGNPRSTPFLSHGGLLCKFKAGFCCILSPCLLSTNFTWLKIVLCIIPRLKSSAEAGRCVPWSITFSH